MSDDPEISVVVPVFNEEGNIPDLDAEIRTALASLDRPAEILYVDDGSTDRSLEIVTELAQRPDDDVRVRVLKLRRNFGQTAALAAGFDFAEGNIIISLDGDGQNDPADIPRLLSRLDEGYDVVSGWRRQRQDKAVSRRLPSWAANRLISIVSGVPLHDTGCTLKAYRSRFLKDVRLWGEMHRFIPVYLARVGARITEIEVGHRSRGHGESHYGSERIFKVLLDLVLIRFMSRYFTRPMHFFGQASLLFIMLSFMALALMVIFKYGWLHLVGIDYQASFVETPLPALTATFLSSAVTTLFLGILGEILVRIYHELGQVKPYAVESPRSSRPERQGIEI